MGLCQNESFDTALLRCIRISKMQGTEDDADRIPNFRRRHGAVRSDYLSQHQIRLQGGRHCWGEMQNARTDGSAPVFSLDRPPSLPEEREAAKAYGYSKIPVGYTHDKTTSDDLERISALFGED